VGQEVAKGEGLLILEAMKMENVLKAEDSGVVKSVNVSVGEAVEKNNVLIEFES
jgi:biotin carboxyl carrier protein